MSKTVLITGASRGLGKALAQEFAARGDGLILAARKWSGIAWNRKDTVYHGDLRSSESITDLAGEATRQDIDILIHNAAVYSKQDFSDSTEEAWQECLNVNLAAPINLTRAIWPIFERKRSGLIVFINSIAGKQGSDGETAYCASKHGLAGFARSLQFDAARIGVRVLSVFLGGMKTDMTRHREDWDKLMDPQEVARTIVGLCEDYETLGIREVDIGRTIY